MSENKYLWTVMIYLAGNNSLSEECVYALTEMAAAVPAKEIALVAQLNTGVHDGTKIRIDKDTSKPEHIHKALKEALTKANGNQYDEERDNKQRIFSVR